MPSGHASLVGPNGTVKALEFDLPLAHQCRSPELRSYGDDEGSSSCNECASYVGEEQPPSTLDGALCECFSEKAALC